MNRSLLLSAGITVLLALLKLLNSPQAAAEETVVSGFASQDQNSDGVIEFKEWLTSPEDDRSFTRRRKFYLLDVNEDGRLSEVETRENEKRAVLTPLNAFRFHDLNADEVLVHDEYVAASGVAETGMPVVRQNFQVLDFDGSGGLSWAEFRSWPGLTSPRERGTVPDPILDLLEQTREFFAQLRVFVDEDQDGQLSAAEWALISFSSERQPFQEIPFERWDTDGNGTVSQAEADQLLAICYGVQHPDGTLLHLPTGIRFYGGFLRPLDKNNDGWLSPDELTSGYWGGKEKGLALFQELDSDKNQQLSPAEIMATQPLTVDILSGMLHLDRDKDGRMSPEELLANASTGATSLGITQTLAAFDDNRDGYLSLSEFQLAPLGYGYVTLRVHGRSDLDHDGALSWQEFYVEQSPVLLGLAWEIFRRYDTDRNGKLTLDEFEFRVDPSKIPTDVQFLTVDKNRDGTLTLDELFSEAEPAEADTDQRSKYVERRRYWQTWIQFADQDHDAGLTPEEYQSAVVGFPAVVYARFASWDKNSDGQLTVEEYLANANAPDEKLVRRNFRVLDFDGSGGLSFDEFRSYPGQLPGNQRGTTPDPVVELWTRALQSWGKISGQADANQDGELSAEEWKSLLFPKSFAPFQDLSFDLWDRDQNGMVSQADAQSLLAIAYGVRHRDGTLLRLPAGIRYYDSFLRPLDANQDQVLSPEELAGGYWGGKEKGLALFQELDLNHDGQLTPSEIMQTQTFTVDVLGAFLSVDTDLDGLASPAELLAYPSSGATPLGITQTLSAFDEDRDGFLSYVEYQLAPLGYGYVTMRIHGRRDQDHDGALSWPEFYIENSPVLMGFAWELFQRHDRDENGQLALDELEFQIDARKVPLKILFTAQDTNKNQRLEKTEYQAVWGTAPAVLRNFSVVDFDHNHALSLDEFLSLPSTPLEQRQNIPDPAVNLATQALQLWKEATQFDSNSKGRGVPSRSWPGARLKDLLGPVGELHFSVWDANRDGLVDLQEAEALLAVAYGLKLPDGTPLRHANGLVLFSAYLDRIDKNRDGVITPEEFIPQYWEKTQKAAVLYQQLDTDRDRQLSYADFWKTPSISIDTYNAFLYLDQDLNGRVSRPELLASQSSGATPQRIEQMFAVFDDDHDGQLTLKEYRLLPFGMGYITYEIWGRQDLDNNGYLSWKEFFPEQQPLLMGYVWELFRRFDQDQDGRLGYDEFEYQVNPAKVPVEMEFRILDRNRDHRIEFTEIFRDQKPDAGRKTDLHHYQVRMARAEDKFLYDDQDHDGSLTLEEFTLARKAVIEAAERHRRATGRAAAVETSSWFLPAFLVIDAIALAIGGWFVLRRRSV